MSVRSRKRVVLAGLLLLGGLSGCTAGPDGVGGQQMALISHGNSRGEVLRALWNGCRSAMLQSESSCDELWQLGNHSQMLYVGYSDQGKKHVDMLSYFDSPKAGIYVGKGTIRPATARDLARKPQRVLAPCMEISRARATLMDLGARYRPAPAASVLCTGPYGGQSGWVAGDPNLVVVQGPPEGLGSTRHSEFRIGAYGLDEVAFREGEIELRWRGRPVSESDTMEDVRARDATRRIPLRK